MPESLLIQPGRFVASGGKLDSNKLYVRQAKTGATDYMALPGGVSPPSPNSAVINIGFGGDFPNVYATLLYDIDQASVRVGTSSPPIEKPFLKVVI